MEVKPIVALKDERILKTNLNLNIKNKINSIQLTLCLAFQWSVVYVLLELLLGHSL